MPGRSVSEEEGGADSEVWDLRYAENDVKVKVKEKNQRRGEDSVDLV